MTPSFPTRRSSDLDPLFVVAHRSAEIRLDRGARARGVLRAAARALQFAHGRRFPAAQIGGLHDRHPRARGRGAGVRSHLSVAGDRSEEHTSELQSLMRISYAVFCLKKKSKK